MKTKLIIAAATVTGALLLTYFMRKRDKDNTVAEPMPVKKSHHLTDVFAHAKNHIE